MEPLVASTSRAVLRPQAVALQSDLAHLMRDGRLLAGQVLSGTTDGRLMLAIGQHRVPAQADVRLESGRSFLFRVEETSQGLLLRVLDDGAAREPALLRALRDAVPYGKPLGELLGDLRRFLSGALAEAPLGPQASALRGLIAMLASAAWSGSPQAASLWRAFVGSGLLYENHLLQAAASGWRPGADTPWQADPRADLKAALLAALRASGDEAVREELAKALAGLEAEQLLNVARERAGEPMVWSLPILDGPAGSEEDEGQNQVFATLRWFVQRRPMHGDGHEGAEEESSRGLRVVMGLTLRALGPLRIDWFLTRTALSLRLVSPRADVVARLRADVEEISAALGSTSAPAFVAVRLGGLEEATVLDRPLDTAFLQENALMDVSA